MNNTAQRKNETHQNFANLDTFKFSMHIKNNSTHYEELQRIFESSLNNWNASVIKEEVKSFLKSKKDYVKQNEEDFFISNVDFDSLVEYYVKDYIDEYLKYKMEAFIETHIKTLGDSKNLIKHESSTHFYYSIEYISTRDKIKIYKESDIMIQHLISTNDDLSLIDLKNNTCNKSIFVNHDVHIDEKEKIAVSRILCDEGEYYYLRKIKY